MARRRAARPKDEGSFHHGNLREELVARLLEVLDAEGQKGVGVRRLARDLGVDPAAVYRHFASLSALLGAAAQACFEGLAEATERAMARAGEDPRARLRAAGEAYVRYALRYPARFRTMFAPRASGPEAWPRERGRGPRGRTAWEAIAQTVEELHREAPMPVGPELGAQAAWAAMHGLAALLLDGPLRDASAARRREVIDATLEVTLAGLSPRAS